MDPDPRSRRTEQAVWRLATTIREIQQRAAADHDLLLTDLLRAAWPTGQAQRQ